MRVLNIVTSPRKDQSASRALVDAFLREYTKQADDVVVDTLDVWQEWLPEFDAETINAKYKGVSGEPMTPAEVTAWKKIRELALRFQSADRIAIGVPMWNFSFPYKLKQLIDLSCQRNVLFISATVPRSTSRRHLSRSFEGKATTLDLRQFRSPDSSI